MLMGKCRITTTYFEQTKQFGLLTANTIYLNKVLDYFGPSSNNQYFVDQLNFHENAALGQTEAIQKR